MLNFLTLCFWCWNQSVKFYDCDIQKSDEFPLPLPTNGNVSLWWPLALKPLFQLLICLLLLGAFRPILVVPTGFQAVNPLSKQKSLALWANLCSLIRTSRHKLKTQEGRKNWETHTAAQFPTRGTRKEFCVHKHMQRGTGMSKSAGSEEFNAVVCWKQSPFRSRHICLRDIRREYGF